MSTLQWLGTSSCILYDDNCFYYGLCLAKSLPFVHISVDEDFFDEIGISSNTLKNTLADNNVKLNLYPYEDLDENFAGNNDLNADSCHYNYIGDQVLDYCDSEQLNYRPANFEGMKRELTGVDWGSLLSGDVEEDWARFRDFMHDLERRYVPLRRSGRPRKAM